MSYCGVKNAILKSPDVKSCYFELNNGEYMPILGLGTYRMKEKEEIHTILETALTTGYRLIDTATVYRNEEMIGDSLQRLQNQYGIARSELFITSKLAPYDHGKEKARAAVVNSLKKLNLSYIDLYLIHWPGAENVHVSSDQNRMLRKESWIELEQCVENGLIKSIGVSNYTLKHLEELYGYCSIQPVVNQVEYHLYNKYSKEFQDFCGTKNILLQAYSTFGGAGVTGLFENSTAKQIAQLLNVSVAQILLRWSLQNGWAVIPKSSNPDRVIENSKLDFVIPPEEMKALDSIETKIRYQWDPTPVV